MAALEDSRVRVSNIYAKIDYELKNDIKSIVEKLEVKKWISHVKGTKLDKNIISEL